MCTVHCDGTVGRNQHTEKISTAANHMLGFLSGTLYKCPQHLSEQSYKVIVTYRHSIAEWGGCFQRRLFVCQFVFLFVSTITLNDYETWQLVALYKNLAEFEFWGHGLYPWVSIPQNVAVCWVTTQKQSTNGCGHGSHSSEPCHHIRQ